MKCLIIAAGLGSRLSARGDLKPLIKLNGVALIQRVISTSMKAGINDFFVVVGYKSDLLKKFLSELQEKLNITITPIDNPDWKKPNGISVLSARTFLKETILLTMTDHIYEPTIIQKLQKVPLESDEVILAVDYKIQSNPLIDIDDVTKVLVENGKIKNIGKEIKNFNAFDTGIFYSSPALFKALSECRVNGEESLSAGIKHLADQGKARVFDVGNEFWIDVDDDNALEKAVKLLSREI